MAAKLKVNSILTNNILQGSFPCLHYTSMTFIPVRVHPSSLLLLCISLHDTGRKFVVPENIDTSPQTRFF